MLSPDAEAEIERLTNAWYAGWCHGGRKAAQEMCRQAMQHAYKDAARVCRERLDEPMSYCGEWDAKIGWIKLDVAKDCAAAIESRLGETGK